jgi:hypothetical protein
MNIYQEVYNTVQEAIQSWYEVEVNPFKRHPDDQIIMTDEAVERKWTFVAKYLQQHASEEIITAAKEKYPILQQIFQNNESEVRS